MRIEVPGFISSLLVGAGEGEVYAIHGRIEDEGDGYVFMRDDGVRIPMEPEWLERAKPIKEDLRGIFGSASQGYIRLSVGSMPEDADASDCFQTGLKPGGRDVTIGPGRPGEGFGVARPMSGRGVPPCLLDWSWTAGGGGVANPGGKAVRAITSAVKPRPCIDGQATRQAGPWNPSVRA